MNRIDFTIRLVRRYNESNLLLIVKQLFSLWKIDSTPCKSQRISRLFIDWKERKDMCWLLRNSKAIMLTHYSFQCCRTFRIIKTRLINIKNGESIKNSWRFCFSVGSDLHYLFHLVVWCLVFGLNILLYSRILNES